MSFSQQLLLNFKSSRCDTVSLNLVVSYPLEECSAFIFRFKQPSLFGLLEYEDEWNIIFRNAGNYIHYTTVYSLMWAVTLWAKHYLLPWRRIEVHTTTDDSNIFYTITLCTLSALTSSLRYLKLLTRYGGSSLNHAVFTICLFINVYLNCNTETYLVNQINHVSTKLIRC
jgi:hypothetical protein